MSVVKVQTCFQRAFCFAVLGCYSAAVIGAFRRCISSAVRCCISFLLCFFIVNCFKFRVWLVELRVIVANHRPTCSIPSIIPVYNWKQSLVLVDTWFSLTETSVVRLIKDSSNMKSYSYYEVNSLCKRHRNHWSNKKSNRFCQCCSGVMLGIKIILNLLVKSNTACN